MDRNGLTHIIFDLGGVLINLDTQRTLKAFQALAPDADFNWSEMYHHPVALQYEQGLISDDEFRQGIRDILQKDISDEQIDTAWNAMILDFPEDRFDLLSRLSEHYTLLLLSNTNDIHLRFVHDKILALGFESLDQHFTRAHYSHRMKMRKPDAIIYQTLLAENKLDPGQSLFIDDNPYNIESAAALGIHTHHLTDITTLTGYLENTLLP